MASCTSGQSAASSKGCLAKSDSSLSISSFVPDLALAAGSKRRLSAEVSDPPAGARASKQPCLTSLTQQERDSIDRPLVQLSRSDSGMSADTQLLCTEAFGIEDDSSSAPVAVPGVGQANPGADAAPTCCNSPQRRAQPVEDKCGVSAIPGPEDMIIELTSLYGFSAYAAQLGTTYFARLCRLDRSLLTSAMRHPILAPLVRSAPQQAMLTGQRAARVGATIKAFCPPHQWVMAVLLVCIFVAAKNVEALRYRRLLPSMLSHALNLDVQPAQATIVEMECLQALEWRLGPHFHTA